jgi:hypothetical protein
LQVVVSVITSTLVFIEYFFLKRNFFLAAFCSVRQSRTSCFYLETERRRLFFLFSEKMMTHPVDHLKCIL